MWSTSPLSPIRDADSDDRAAGTDAAAAAAVDAPAVKCGKHDVSAPAAAKFLTLPDAVLLYLADAFLLDDEVVRCARTCQFTFHALQKYRFKKDVRMDNALGFADGSSTAVRLRAETAAAVVGVNVARADPIAAAASAEPVTVIASIGAATSSPLADAPDVSAPLPLRSPQRIGVLQRVRCEVYTRRLLRLAWLPRSVTSLHVTSPWGVKVAIDGLLPPLLSSLHIGFAVVQPPAGWQLPATLTSFKLDSAWTRMRDLILPDGLQSLDLANYFCRNTLNVADAAAAPLLPPLLLSLTLLSLSDDWDGAVLPPLPLALTDINLNAFLTPVVQLQSAARRTEAAVGFHPSRS